jgi:phosphopantothenoylcysteine decarboxylase/phosphopantothenate--cysteine ligase
MGLALAKAALDRLWNVTLLAGPIPLIAELEDLQSLHSSKLSVDRFRSCADLQSLLRTRISTADVLIMAAAVADFRPKVDPALFTGKFRRHDQSLNLELEPTPDLLAEVAASRRPEQFMVGFALEPRHELELSARNKLTRKRVDMVVGNPLETMDSEVVEALVLSADGSTERTAGTVRKQDFAPWLLQRIETAVVAHWAECRAAKA